MPSQKSTPTYNESLPLQIFFLAKKEALRLYMTMTKMTYKMKIHGCINDT